MGLAEGTGPLNNNGPSPSPLQGSSDDDVKWLAYEVHMVVGPIWHSVTDVSPIVAVAGYSFSDPDTANDSGCEVNKCTWDTVGLLESPGSSLKRIRLKVFLRMCGGEDFSVTKLAYHLVAVGTRWSSP